MAHTLNSKQDVVIDRPETVHHRIGIKLLVHQVNHTSKHKKNKEHDSHYLNTIKSIKIKKDSMTGKHKNNS